MGIVSIASGKGEGWREREKKYVIIDGLGSKDGRAHCHNSAQMMNSEPVGMERVKKKNVCDY